MRKSVFKLFMAWQNEKEEAWLNDMSAKGMQLVKLRVLFYTFEEGTAGEYIYRIELLNDLPSSKKSAEYISFLEDTGVEYIGSCIRWIYLRKKATEGPFDIYSDIDSQIKQTNRILVLLLSAVLPLFCIALVTLFGHIGSPSDFQNGFTVGFSIVAVPCIIWIITGATQVFRKRKLLEKEKKLRE